MAENVDFNVIQTSERCLTARTAVWKIYLVKQGSTQLWFSPLLALVISLVLSLKCRHYRKKIDIGHVHLMFTKWSLILGKIYLKNTACVQLQCLHFEYLVNQVFFHAQFSCLCIYWVAKRMEEKKPRNIPHKKLETGYRVIFVEHEKKKNTCSKKIGFTKIRKFMFLIFC